MNKVPLALVVSRIDALLTVAALTIHTIYNHNSNKAKTPNQYTQNNTTHYGCMHECKCDDICTIHSKCSMYLYSR